LSYAALRNAYDLLVGLFCGELFNGKTTVFKIVDVGSSPASLVVCLIFLVCVLLLLFWYLSTTNIHKFFDYIYNKVGPYSWLVKDKNKKIINLAKRHRLINMKKKAQYFFKNKSFVLFDVYNFFWKQIYYKINKQKLTDIKISNKVNQANYNFYFEYKPFNSGFGTTQFIKA
jgi:hypothetical protein